MRASAIVRKTCANYEPSAPSLFAGLDDHYDLPWPALAETDVYPELQRPFFRRPPHVDVFDEHYDQAAPELEILSGTFGLMPWWTKEPAMARRTYNARTETVSKKPACRDAWACGQHCLIPVKAFFEPDWRSGKSVRTRFELVDGGPMMIAGLWDRCKFGGTDAFSFTMLTINADDHPLLRR